jgi:hypothetical protein
MVPLLKMLLTGFSFFLRNLRKSPIFLIFHIFASKFSILFSQKNTKAKFFGSILPLTVSYFCPQ